MKNKHTPGPWEYSCHQRTIGSPNNWQIKKHEFSEPPYEGDLENEYGIYPPLGNAGPVALVAGKANAVLFAAATDLLEALQVVLYQVDYTADRCRLTEGVGTVLDKDTIALARAAIAKAEA
jgi:hypothetical protein